MTNSEGTNVESTGFLVKLLVWLQTTQGIIIAITGLLGSIAAIASLFLPGRVQNASPLKEFTVSADSATGYTYNYPENEQPATLIYTAAGRWIGIPIAENHESVPRGEIDANGYSGFAANPSMPCPDYPLGALVVKDEVKCLAGGEKGTFEAVPGYNYQFVMNDVYNKYDDNKHALTVNLSKKSMPKGKK